MTELELKLDNGIPQYSCSVCKSCNSIYGKSLIFIQNRGCCWYFPKFNLHLISRIAKDEEGLKILDRILGLPKTKLNNYSIHAIGLYDQDSHQKYRTEKEELEEKVSDDSIFFRACPFVLPDVGCTLPAKFRSHVCNFYICDEVVKELQKFETFSKYIKARDYYVKWVEWENRSLELLLQEKGLTLASNTREVIDLLRTVSDESFEFPSLPSIISSEIVIEE